jgi:hypothetical protein
LLSHTPAPQASISTHGAAEPQALAGAQQAAAALQQLYAETSSLSSTANQIASHCGGLAEQQAALLAGLAAQALAAELSQPPATWLSSETGTALALCAPAGKAACGLLEEAVPAPVRGRLRAGLLQACAEADAQGVALLRQRDDLILGGMTALLQYRQVARELLPAGYAESGHHHG